MKKFLLLMACFNTMMFEAIAQAPPIQWEKSLGGSSQDIPYSILQNKQGGFVVAGYSNSNDADVKHHHGIAEVSDYWIVFLDDSGNPIFQKSLGGSGSDYGYSACKTNDGGTMIAGTSASSDGDVTGNHGGYDFWMVKLSARGRIQWEKSLGGSYDDIAYDVKQTADDGFIIAGMSALGNGDVTENHGGSDYWIVKTDSAGNIQWQKSFGGSYEDVAYSVQQTSDGQYIATGKSYSSDGDITGHHGTIGYTDYWVVKLDGAGNLQWEKSLGGTSYDEAKSILQTPDGGYLIAGDSYSADGDVTEHHGINNGTADYWIVKLDDNGNIQWEKSLGGSNDDFARSIAFTSDHGYIIAGISDSHDGDVTGHIHFGDYWIVKTDSTGDILWQECLGGHGTDEASSIRQTNDDGYIVAGYSTSGTGEVTGHHGDYSTADYWIVKLNSEGKIETKKPLEQPSLSDNVSIFPNPVCGDLNFHLAGIRDIAIISVTDLFGRVLQAEKISVDDQSDFILQLSPQLVNGLYLLKVESGNQSFQKIFEVQR